MWKLWHFVAKLALSLSLTQTWNFQNICRMWHLCLSIMNLLQTHHSAVCYTMANLIDWVVKMQQSAAVNMETQYWGLLLCVVDCNDSVVLSLLLFAVHLFLKSLRALSRWCKGVLLLSHVQHDNFTDVLNQETNILPLLFITSMIMSYRYQNLFKRRIVRNL